MHFRRLIPAFYDGSLPADLLERSVGVVPAAFGGDVLVARKDGRREHPIDIKTRVASVDSERGEGPVKVGNGIEGFGIMKLKSVVVHVAGDGDRTHVARVVATELEFSNTPDGDSALRVSDCDPSLAKMRHRGLRGGD